MLVLHVNWAEGALRLWGESLPAYLRRDADTPAIEPPDDAASTLVHDFALGAAQLKDALLDQALLEPNAAGEERVIRFSLPGDDSGPRPSDQLAGVLGPLGSPAEMRLLELEVPTLELRNDCALAAALRLEDIGPTDAVEFGQSLRYWIAVARYVLELIEDQRFIPTLVQSRGDGLQAGWQPWLHDEPAQTRVGILLATMPPIARAVSDANQGDPWPILDDALRTLTDATVRSALIDERFIESIEDRDARSDPHVAWCEGLLDRRRTVASPDGSEIDLLRDVRSWIDQLDETGRGRSGFHLCFRLEEPSVGDRGDDADDADAFASGDEEKWRLSLLLLADGEPQVTIEAAQVWAGSPTTQGIDGRRLDRPHEFLLAELGRASGIYPLIETALSDPHPTGIDLATPQAVQFLREHRPVLEDSGFKVIVPQWWDRPTGRLGVRLQLETESLGPGDSGASTTATSASLGLDSLVCYRWQLAVGEHALSLDRLRQLVEIGSPLVRIGPQWVEIGADDLARASALLENDRGGQVTLGRAIRIAHGLEDATHGLPVVGTDTAGWVREFFNDDRHEDMLRLDQPAKFLGTLRPYQKMGLSWLAFLERCGLGACLADDMGLGKTIELIALLLHERQDVAQRPGPTLLVVPTSVVGNWSRELERFSPSLSFHIHHGPDRLLGQEFAQLAGPADVVITTYALVPRDVESLGQVQWHRIVLDEAQYIKNPPTRQATAIRGIQATRRIAMTGTPVENRLSELWSIMEFCNPGFLGSAQEFRRRFAVPIERHRDQQRADALRRIVGPFVLRRLKSDPNVIADLPACVETKEFATLVPEQAALYQAVVDRMLTSVDEAEGIQRRGLILATLTKLKQICNHPANLPSDDRYPDLVGSSGDRTDAADHRSLSGRSGKCARLIHMLEEVLAAGDRALLFTQYHRMGNLLEAMIRHDLDCEVLYMHGGTPRLKRQQLIDRFQAASIGPAVFILSLKAGGVGLNLTAANHVFHFDRWWNPAVEKQATDRAFRIGQTRTVHVHKFVCIGTLEEQIDQMIEKKAELAENILGSGERWLTELSTEQLRDALRLRHSALEVQT